MLSLSRRGPSAKKSYFYGNFLLGFRNISAENTRGAKLLSIFNEFSIFAGDQIVNLVNYGVVPVFMWYYQRNHYLIF